MFENIFVVIDHNARYAQAFPIRNQKAKTAGEALCDNSAAYYGFPIRLQSELVANFESNLQSDGDEGSQYTGMA